MKDNVAVISSPGYRPINPKHHSYNFHGKLTIIMTKYLFIKGNHGKSESLRKKMS